MTSKRILQRAKSLRILESVFRVGWPEARAALRKILAGELGGEEEDLWPNPGIGLNGEVTATLVPIKRSMVQLSYRYQMFVLRARGPGRDDIHRAFDITHGPGVSVLYTF